MKLQLNATPEEVMRAVGALEELGRARGVPEASLCGLLLAVEECASNVVNHALRRDATQTFFITVAEVSGRLAVELRDGGPAFDPTQVPERTPGPEDEDLPPGGWGIQLVRRNVAEVHYRREGGDNVLTLVAK